MKTHSVKQDEVTREWYIFDASDVTLGRLASRVAKLLLGKDKTTFSHHVDCGDYVIVLNSNKLVVTGKKMKDKVYYKHSGYPGGLTELTLEEKMDRDSTDVIFRAVRGMLPVNKLRDARLARLKIYKDDQHPHDPQKPVKVSMKESS